MGKLRVWHNAADTFIWDTDPQSRPLWRRALVKLLRGVYVLVRDLNEGQLTLHAMSLVYTTLLSLVPLLAFSFSVLKGLGVHNRLEPMLFAALEYLGPRGEELGDRIMGFVENVRADVLGSIGLALLIYLIISLIQKMEDSFNYVWRVQKPRSFARRFANYLTVILIGPLFITVAISITATVTSSKIVQQIAALEPMGMLIIAISWLVPYLLVIGVFTFMYMFIPNTQVRFLPALVGGIVAGLVWQTAGWIFANFVAGSARYVAIYSSFAIMLTFMIWLYLNWLILLVGAQVAFYFQNPRFVTKQRGRLNLSNEMRECLALEVMYLVGSSYHGSSALWGIEQLSRHLRIPGDILAPVTERLEHAGLLLVTEGPDSRFVPGRDLESIPLETIRAAVRRTDPELDHDERNVPVSGPVSRIKADVEQAAQDCLVGKTLRDLVRGE